MLCSTTHYDVVSQKYIAFSDNLIKMLAGKRCRVAARCKKSVCKEKETLERI